MDRRIKTMAASIAVLALVLTAVTGVTYSWMSDTGNAGMHVDTGKVTADRTVTYMIDASEDRLDHTAATNEEMLNGYMFGFDGKAEAVVEDGRVRVNNMVANDALTMVTSASIGHSVSIAYRVSAVVDAAEPASDDDFTVAFYRIDGSTETEIEVEDVDQWTVLDVADGDGTEDLGTYRIEVRLDPSSNAQKADAVVELKIEAYQLNGILPDGTLTRTAAQGQKIVQRIASSNTQVDYAAVSFTAPSAGEYVVTGLDEAADGKAYVEYKSTRYGVMAGMSVSANDSSTDLSTQTAVLAFVFDESLWNGTDLADGYEIIGIDNGTSTAIDLSKYTETDEVPSTGQYRSTVTSEKVVLEIGVQGLHPYYLVADLSKMVKVTLPNGTTSYQELSKAVNEMNDGRTVEVFEDGLILYVSDPVVGADGKLVGVPYDNGVTPLFYLYFNGGAETLFKNPVDLAMKDLYLCLQFDPEDPVLAPLTDAVNPDASVTLSGLTVVESTTLEDRMDVPAFLVGDFRGKELTITDCTVTMGNSPQDAASTVYPEYAAAFVGSVSLVGDGEVLEHGMTITFDSCKVERPIQDEDEERYQVIYEAKNTGVFFGTVKELGDQDVSMLSLTVTGCTVDDVTFRYVSGYSLFGDSESEFGSGGSLYALAGLYEIAEEGTTVGSGVVWTQA